MDLCVEPDFVTKFLLVLKTGVAALAFVGVLYFSFLAIVKVWRFK